MANGDVTQNPWDSDLETAFEDEAQRQAVSEFLSGNIQPYITKLEQEGKENRDANLLWEQYHEKPVETSVQVVEELFGKDKAEAFADLLQGVEEAQEAAEKPDEEKPVEPGDDTTEGKQGNQVTQVEFDQLPPEVQEVVSREQQESQRKAYYAEIDRIKTEHSDELPKDAEGNPVLNADTFHPFVISADGNFDAAYEGFTKWLDEARQTFGLTGQEPSTDGQTTPPPTIDSRTRDASAAPPTVKTGQTLDDAMDEMFNELKSPPPTVGGV
jgi:hypothetical protein